jgi:hypothetical protein
VQDLGFGEWGSKFGGWEFRVWGGFGVEALWSDPSEERSDGNEPLIAGIHIKMLAEDASSEHFNGTRGSSKAGLKVASFAWPISCSC